MYIYIARQPIFNADRTVQAYELLYRSSETNAFDSSISGDKATRQLLSQALVDFGIQTITNDKRAYVNFTEALLMTNLPLLLDKRMFVLEILEDVNLNTAVIKRLKNYRDHGYMLALDDYCGASLEEEVVDLLDIIKIDFMKTTPEIRAQIARDIGNRPVTLLAEKVETEQDFQEAVSLGCRLFQGYYLAKPLVMKKKSVQMAQSSMTRLFHMLTDDAYNVDVLSDSIRIDAHLTYKLLQKMRTTRYYRGKVVSTVKDALVRLGMNETRRWITLMLMQDLTGTAADEQVYTALVRAVFCEKMASEKKNPRLSSDAFLTGIFSVLDADEAEFGELLSMLDVSPQACEALVHKKENELTRYLDTAVIYENHDWDQLLRLYSDKQAAKLQKYYVDAIKYANDALTDVK